MRFLMTVGLGRKRALSCRVTSATMLLWSSTRRAFIIRTTAASICGFRSSSTCEHGPGRSQHEPSLMSQQTNADIICLPQVPPNSNLRPPLSAASSPPPRAYHQEVQSRHVRACGRQNRKVLPEHDVHLKKMLRNLQAYVHLTLNLHARPGQPWHKSSQMFTRTGPHQIT